MSICNACRTKGNCCKGFCMNFNTSRDADYMARVTYLLKQHNLEFMIPRRAPYYDTEETLGFQFDCSKLGEDGLCTDYENRPELCKSYQPQQDALCCEYVYNFKGIPVTIDKALRMC